MTTPRAVTIEEIVGRLKTFLIQHHEISWCRFWLDTAVAKVRLIVMPSSPWWSGLELQMLTAEVNELLGRTVDLEDERALSPHRYEKILDEETRDNWEMLIDRDPLRQLQIWERYCSWSLTFSQIRDECDALRSTRLTAQLLQSPSFQKESDDRFGPLAQFIEDGELFGTDVWPEEDWGRISSASREAGQRALEICCYVRSLFVPPAISVTWVQSPPTQALSY